MGWKNTGESERFDFENKGDELTGHLIDMKKTREFDSKVYTLVDDNDDSHYFFGCHALDARLPALIDRRVMITYKGKRSHVKGKTIREFDILVWSTFDDEEPDDKTKPKTKSKGKAKTKKGSKQSTSKDDVPF